MLAPCSNRGRKHNALFSHSSASGLSCSPGSALSSSYSPALPFPPAIPTIHGICRLRQPHPLPDSACSRLSYLDTSELTPAFFCSVYFSSPVFSFQLIFFRPFRRSFVLESSEDAHRTLIQPSLGNQSWLLRALFCYSIRYRVERTKTFLDSSPPSPARFNVEGAVGSVLVSEGTVLL